MPSLILHDFSHATADVYADIMPCKAQNNGCPVRPRPRPPPPPSIIRGHWQDFGSSRDNKKPLGAMEQKGDPIRLTI